MKQHTLQEGKAAMQCLIDNTGLNEGDFYLLYGWEASELGLEDGTPCVINNDDSIITAYEHWLNWLWVQDEKAQDEYLDYMIDTLYPKSEANASTKVK